MPLQTTGENKRHNDVIAKHGELKIRWTKVRGGWSPPCATNLFSSNSMVRVDSL